MNDTEPFDDRVREALKTLDTSPEHFRQAAVWQKLQTELHPVSEKKSFFILRFAMPTVRRAQASKLRIAAAAALLLLAGGAWWKIQSIPIPAAGHQAENKPQSSSVLPQKQPLPAAENDVLHEEVTFKKQVLPKRKSNAKPTEIISLAQAPTAALLESADNAGGDRPAPADRSGVPNPADVIEASKNTAELSEVVPVPVIPANSSTAKTVPKPKFKIVHANELADYQKAELAEARQKEAKDKGFIIINWHANTSTQPQSNVVTYLKKKSSKAD